MARYPIHRVIRADTRADAVRSSKSDFVDATITDNSELPKDHDFRNLHFDYLVVEPEKKNKETIVVVLDDNHDIDNHHLGVLETVAQLRIYRRRPYRQRWSRLAQVGTGGLIALISTLAVIASNVTNVVKNATEADIAKKTTEALPTYLPPLFHPSPLASATTLTTASAPSPTNMPQVTPKSAASQQAPQAAPMKQPADLRQAIQNYVGDQLKPYLSPNAAAAHLRLWSQPEADYDKASETARCKLEASIEDDKGGILLARRKFGFEYSGEGSTPDQVTESACRVAADKLISSFRVQH